MEKDTILHALAVRLVKSLSLADNYRAIENKQINIEAKEKGLHPNQVVVYVQGHYNELMAEATGTEGTLSAFTAKWQEANPEKQPNGPEFLAALSKTAAANPSFNFNA